MKSIGPLLLLLAGCAAQSDPVAKPAAAEPAAEEAAVETSVPEIRLTSNLRKAPDGSWLRFDVKDEDFVGTWPFRMPSVDVRVRPDRSIELYEFGSKFTALNGLAEKNGLPKATENFRKKSALTSDGFVPLDDFIVATVRLADAEFGK